MSFAPRKPSGNFRLCLRCQNLNSTCSDIRFLYSEYYFSYEQDDDDQETEYDIDQVGLNFSGLNFTEQAAGPFSGRC